MTTTQFHFCGKATAYLRIWASEEAKQRVPEKGSAQLAGGSGRNHLEALAPEGGHAPCPTVCEDVQRAGSEPSSRGAAAAAAAKGQQESVKGN